MKVYEKEDAINFFPQFLHTFEVVNLDTKSESDESIDGGLSLSSLSVRSLSNQLPLSFYTKLFSN